MDRGQLARILGMLGSAHDGEIVNAARLAVRLVKQAGLTWDELLREGEIAVEAAQHLHAENSELRTQIEELSDRISGIAGTDVWSLKTENVELRNRLAELTGTPGDRFEQVELCRRYSAHLDHFERDFLETVSRWRGRLTDKQQPIWLRIVAKVTRWRDMGIAP